MPFQPNGRKEIKEAVIVAALSAAIGGMINLGIEEFKEWKRKRAEKRDEERTAHLKQVSEPKGTNE